MEQLYQSPEKDLWTGRQSNHQLYLHEKVILRDLFDKSDQGFGKRSIGILGYACDEGVRRNSGRVGAQKGPENIRKALSKLPNHLPVDQHLYDFGDLVCREGDMEETQKALAACISKLNKEKVFCMVLGGGHDLSYGHYNGLKENLGPDAVLGIINFDAHFDLRSNKQGNNSGTPFFQIGEDCRKNKKSFRYLCLGIRKDANDASLYDTASVFGVNYLEMERFHLRQLDLIIYEIEHFIQSVDAVYVTIDLDGFSSAYAPGVSAPSPLGFTPELVLECLKTIIHTKKLVGIDFAEMNPQFDKDDQTAKLAAGLLHFVMHRISLF